MRTGFDPIQAWKLCIVLLASLVKSHLCSQNIAYNATIKCSPKSQTGAGLIEKIDSASPCPSNGHPRRTVSKTIPGDPNVSVWNSNSASFFSNTLFSITDFSSRNFIKTSVCMFVFKVSIPVPFPVLRTAFQGGCGSDEVQGLVVGMITILRNRVK